MQHVGVVSGVLVTASLLSKVAADPSPRSALLAQAATLVGKARAAAAAADEGGGPAQRLESLARGVAFLEAARALATDRELEAETGADASRLLARLERRAGEARQALLTRDGGGRPPAAR